MSWKTFVVKCRYFSYSEDFFHNDNIIWNSNYLIYSCKYQPLYFFNKWKRTIIVSLNSVYNSVNRIFHKKKKKLMVKCFLHMYSYNIIIYNTIANTSCKAGLKYRTIFIQDFNYKDNIIRSFQIIVSISITSIFWQ